ncbi:hypothetical protein HNO89_000275 [Sporosarcina luteola]|nr:hypothetical protein [Sporosarcina luteola]
MKEEVDADEPEIVPESEETIIKDVDGEENNIKKLPDSLIKEAEVYIKSFPGVSVIGSSSLDLDGDGVEELIYAYDTNKEKSNIAIVTSAGVSTVSLGNNFRFAYGSDSMRVENDPNRIIVRMRHSEKNLTVDFTISLVRKGDQDIEIQIESLEVK